MITREILGKDYNFNPLSFQAIEELEKNLGYGLYKFIANSTGYSFKEIETAIYAFARAGGNPINRDTLQNAVNEKGINFLTELVNDCIIQILSGQPKKKVKGKAA